MSKVDLVERLTACGVVESRSMARRLIAQGAVRIDGAPHRDGEVDLDACWHHVQIGKRRSCWLRSEPETPKPAAGPEDHPWYGPCDAFGPNGECSECAMTRFTTEEEWLAWLRTAAQP